MSYTKVMLGTKYPKKVKVPDIDTIVEHSQDEMIFLMGHTNEYGKMFRDFMGIGRVRAILKRDTYDLLFIKFGRTMPTRKVVVADNRARRQLLTLKRGDFATVVGFAKAVRRKYTTKDGEYHDYITYFFYAEGIQDWYVPSMVDIKRKKVALGEEEMSDIEISEKEDSSILDFLEEIKGSGGIE